MATELIDRTWLAWLVKIRIILITFLLGIGLAVIRLTQNKVEVELFVSVIALWYTFATFFGLLGTVWKDSPANARLQILTDLVMITAVVYVTGGSDSWFHFLYPLIIINASILLPRWWAYLTAALSFIAYGAVLELSFFNLVRSYSFVTPDISVLQATIFINLFAYMLIAHLASALSQKLRQVDVQLQYKSGALENLRAMHEHIIHSIRGGLITTDMAGRITLLNASGEKLLERSATDVIGTMVQSLFLDTLPAFAAGAVSGEVRGFSKTGKQKTFGMTVSQLTRSNTAVEGFVYTFDDLTDIRRLEREVRMRDRLAAVGRMAAGIAHEIRNPLTSIAGSVQVLSGISVLDQEQRTLVNVVTRESERLNAIISDFLIYSREKNFIFSEADIVALVEDTLTLLQNRPQSSPATIEIEKRFDVEHAPALVDADRMKQVFWNLMENAMRAMPNGGCLTVSISDTGGEWRLCIGDTGVGMDQHQMEKIFEPFQSRFRGGTGLGLAIVYEILEAHGAKISVKSSLNQGTEFAIGLKKAQPAGDAAHWVASAAQTGGKRG